MMNDWLKKHELGTWSHSGRIGADDRTVITPQADANYGYCWFNISNGPMVIELPEYERYCSLTLYNMEDRYLIPNPQGQYSITSYTATANSDGTYTVRINPEGKGENAIPTMRKPVYAVMRVYQPKGTIDFPPIRAARD